MNRLWCTVCQHGVEGVEGQLCPKCVERGKGGNDNEHNDAGVLMTPENASKEHIKRSEAIKLMRDKKQFKPYKSVDDVERELKAKFDRDLAKFKEEITAQLLKDKTTGSEKPTKTPTKSAPSKPLKGDK